MCSSFLYSSFRSLNSPRISPFLLDSRPSLFALVVRKREEIDGTPEFRPRGYKPLADLSHPNSNQALLSHMNDTWAFPLFSPFNRWKNSQCLSSPLFIHNKCPSFLWSPLPILMIWSRITTTLMPFTPLPSPYSPLFPFVPFHLRTGSNYFISQLLMSFHRFLPFHASFPLPIPPLLVPLYRPSFMLLLSLHFFTVSISSSFFSLYLSVCLQF